MATDAQLMERMRSDPTGDSVRALYRTYSSELLGFALNALGDRQAAEEIVQEVFTRAWRHADRYDPERGAVRTWLYQIARHAIIDARRRAAARAGGEGGRAVTTTCRDLRPLLGAYVLGALEPEEAAAVREHVATCTACAAEHTRLAPLPGLLTLAEGAQRATDKPPSPAMEERLLDAIAREAPRRRPARRPVRRRMLGWAAAGLTAAALAMTG